MVELRKKDSKGEKMDGEEGGNKATKHFAAMQQLRFFEPCIRTLSLDDLTFKGFHFSLLSLEILQVEQSHITRTGNRVLLDKLLLASNNTAALLWRYVPIFLTVLTTLCVSSVLCSSEMTQHFPSH